MINSLFPISFKKSQLFCVSLALYELLTYIGGDAIMPGMLTVVTDMQANASYVPWSLNAYLFGGVAFQWLLGLLVGSFWLTFITWRMIFITIAVLAVLAPFLIINLLSDKKNNSVIAESDNL
ncbi:hypothetical protein EIV52_22105 [Salmonella enterica]|nr:hypothetical protein [Salmonella enterica]